MTWRTGSAKVNGRDKIFAILPNGMCGDGDDGKSRSTLNVDSDIVTRNQSMGKVNGKYASLLSYLSRPTFNL